MALGGFGSVHRFLSSLVLQGACAQLRDEQKFFRFNLCLFCAEENELFVPLSVENFSSCFYSFV